MRAAVAVAAALLSGACVGGGGAGPGNGGSSSGGAAAADAGHADGSTAGWDSSARPDAAPVCGPRACTANEACVRLDAGPGCQPRCNADGGCGAATQVCVTLGAPGGPTACVPGGGVADPCQPEPCLAGLLCAHPPDASATCRWPCFLDPDGGYTGCPQNYVCFPASDAGTGACFPR